MRVDRLDLALGLGLLGVTALLALALAPVQPDAAFVGYRYARHLAEGLGFVYNLQSGEQVAAAPFYALLLADASKFIPDLPALGAAISALFVGAGGLLLSWVGRDERTRVEAAFAALAYVTFPLWWLEAGLETALAGLLALGAVLAQSRKWNLAAATLAGMALLLRPVALLLGVLLLLDTALDQRRLPWRELIALALLALLSVVLVVWAFGWPLPPRTLLGGTPAGPPLMTSAPTSRSLAGLGRLAGGLLAQSPVWIGVLLLAVLGFARVLERWWVVTLLVWAALHGIALDVLGATPARGDYAPLVPAFAALVGMGAAFAWETLAERVGRRTVLGGVTLLLVGAVLPSLLAIGQAPSRDNVYHAAHGPAMLPDTPSDAYKGAGEWLADHAPDGARIAAAHTGQLGYYSEHDVLDTGSLLVAGDVGRGDTYSFLPHLAPDYAVLSRTELQVDGGYRPLDDPWFADNYVEVERFGDAGALGGPLVIYERRAEPTQLDDLEVQARFAHGLRLAVAATNLQLDPLLPDELALVRLEWIPGRALPEEQFLLVRLESGEGASAGQTSQRALTGQWTPGKRVTTYHSFETARALAPGLYDLQVGVGPAPDDIEWQTVAQAKVPLGDEPFGGGLTGGGGRWPGVVALRGYRLNRTEDALSVALLWEPLADLDEDYLVRLALYDDNGQEVASVEGAPRENTYPTSIWADGENIPDEHVIDLEGVPPGQYELRVSFLEPDGRAVQTEDGEATLPMGPFFVE